MRRTVAFVAASAALFSVASGNALAGSATTRVSVSGTGAQANAPSRFADLSADGRFIAFDSTASTLVASDTNGVADVFVRDRVTGTTARISVSTAGAQGTGASDSASISHDGRFVAFLSVAPNLVAGDTNGVRDVFVHDRETGTTQRVSLTGSGGQSVAASFAPRISGDGRYVAFATFADLRSGGSAGAVTAYRVERATGAVDEVCVRWDGVALRTCIAPALSHDGRYVAFETPAALLLSDTNGVSDVYVRDIVAGVTVRASVSSSGSQATAASTAPAISADGSAVAFTSLASDLVAGDTNGWRDVFVRDLGAGTTGRISTGVDGAQPNGDSVTRSGSAAGAALSADGRHVAFHSLASNLVAGDANATADVFVHDRGTGTTRVVSLTPSDVPGGLAMDAAISADARFVAFTSFSSALVADDTNGVADIFIRDLTPNAPPALSLPGDMQVHLSQGLEVTAAFTDEDLDQAWSGTVSYGDGTTEALALTADRTFPLAHAYAAIGTYTVQVTLSDGAGGTATGSFDVVVDPDPAVYGDRRTGASLVVQLDPRATDHGRAWVTVPGLGTYAFDASAGMRQVSPSNVLLDVSAPAVLATADGDEALVIELRGRLDPERHSGEATLRDSAGRTFRVVARP